MVVLSRICVHARHISKQLFQVISREDQVKVSAQSQMSPFLRCCLLRKQVAMVALKKIISENSTEVMTNVGLTLDMPSPYWLKGWSFTCFRA